MRTAVTIALLLIASSAFGHSMWGEKVVKAWPYPVEKTIGIDANIINKREAAIYSLYVVEDDVRIPFFALNRKFYLETDEKVTETVYIEHNKPLPRTFLVCSMTVNLNPNSTICIKTTVEDITK